MLFAFTDTTPSDPYTLSLHDALPILAASQAIACLCCAFSGEIPACCSAKVINPVAYPSLFPSCGVPSRRFQAPASEDRLQPPSACCLARTSLMIARCCSGLRSPGNLAEAHKRTTRLKVGCALLSRFKYFRSILRLFWISGLAR